MLVVFSSIFVSVTKIISHHDFVAPLKFWAAMGPQGLSQCNAGDTFFTDKFSYPWSFAKSGENLVIKSINQ